MKIHINARGNRQRLFNNASSHLKLLLFWKARIFHRIGNSHCRYDSVCARCHGDWYNGTDMYNRNTKTLYCLSHRCAATSTGPSVGCEDCRPHFITHHVLGKLLSKPLGAANRSGAANRTVIASHYFLAIAEALVRDMDRLLSAYPQ